MMPITEPLPRREELARRGDEIYESDVRPLLGMLDNGKFVLIDVRTGDYEMDARERLEAGADPSCFDSRSGAALFVAINSRQVEMIHLLMERGENINLTDERGYGALEYALCTGDNAIVAAVLSYGAALKAHRDHWRQALKRHFQV